MDKKVMEQLLKEYHAAENCDGIRGDESIEQILKFLFDHCDYCNNRHFPSLKLWRMADKSMDLQKYGIYVDKGDVDFSNEKKIGIIGDTRAKIFVNENFKHKILVQHGASVDITTDRFGLAIVRADNTAKIVKNQMGNSKILD